MNTKALPTSTTVKPAATAALILGTSPPAPPAPAATEAGRPSRNDLQSDAEKFQKSMRQRSEAPFKPTWAHGGINE